MHPFFIVKYLFLMLPLLAFSNNTEIGKKIWKNECGGKIDGLVSWNVREECASLGIGHFIWYPEGSSQKFDAMFPQYLAFLKEKRISIPDFLLSFEHAPWKSREAFLADEKIALLRDWLFNTIDLQTEFIIQRLQITLKKILLKSPELKTKVEYLCQSSRGLFALIDYLNFKGEGLSDLEKYQGKGWGLYQVLLHMHGNEIDHFKESALTRLRERISGAPNDETHWFQGWKNRIQGY